jgi:interferon gamma-inducible protein 30
MSNIRDNINEVASSCAKQYSLPFDKLLSCANGPLGNQLLHSAGVLTDSLIPKLNYVPWIVVDRVHTSTMQDEAEQDLKTYVCHNYKVNREKFNNLK